MEFVIKVEVDVEKLLEEIARINEKRAQDGVRTMLERLARGGGSQPLTPPDEEPMLPTAP